MRLTRRQSMGTALGLGMAVWLPGHAATQNGQYVGQLDVRFLGDGRLVELLRPFSYIDARGVRWDVPEGAKVDGASIPRPAWSFIGGPFEGPYLNASVIHDWYCDRRTRSTAETHRVFHEAMLTSGVPRYQAAVMYGAVLLGGPRWSDVTVRNNQLTDVEALFGPGTEDLDPGIRIAGRSTISLASESIAPNAATSGEQFAAVVAALPEIDRPSGVWKSAPNQMASTTIHINGSDLTARILGSSGDDAIVLGIEQQPEMMDADFEKLKAAIPADGANTEQIEEAVGRISREIRLREISALQSTSGYR